MEFAEPYGVEPDMIAEFDLPDDVLVTLALRIAGGAGQLVEEPEAHRSSRAGQLAAVLMNPIAWRSLAEQAKAAHGHRASGDSSSCCGDGLISPQGLTPMLRKLAGGPPIRYQIVILAW